MTGPSQCGPQEIPTHGGGPQTTFRMLNGPQESFPQSLASLRIQSSAGSWMGVRRGLLTGVEQRMYLAGLASMPAFSIRIASSVLPALFVQTNARYLMGSGEESTCRRSRRH